MRTQTQCVDDGKAFLLELLSHMESTGHPKARKVVASTATVAWCKARGYAQNVGPWVRGHNYKRNGWVVTSSGQAWLKELPA